jgi:beta-galactosidase
VPTPHRAPPAALATATLTTHVPTPKGYLPFNYSWYRKTFAVDAAWAGQPVWIDFDGVYRASDYWLNGVYVGHWESGYAPFRWYIHNVSGAPLSVGGAPNVLAVRIDGVSHQEGWFYEGSGITRTVTLNTAPALNLVPWGIYAPSVITGAISSPLGLAGAQTAASAVVDATVDVQNSGAAADSWALALTLYDAAGGVAATGAASGGPLAPGGWARAAVTLALVAPTLWSVSTPYLYTLAAALTAGAAKTVDAANVTIGVRSAIFDANAGLLLNGLPHQIRGFSQHQDFGGLGTAVPDRVQRYRVESLRALGMTGWRTAHNPVASNLLALTDELGVLVMAENRNLERQVVAAGAPRRAGGPPNDIVNISAFPDPQYLLEAAQMVLRDRNHPSIIM